MLKFMLNAHASSAIYRHMSPTTFCRHVRYKILCTTSLSCNLLDNLHSELVFSISRRNAAGPLESFVLSELVQEIMLFV